MTLSKRQIRLIAAFAGLNVLLIVGGWIALVSPQRHTASTAAANVQLAQSQLNDLLRQSSPGGGPAKQPVIHTSCLYKLDTALPAQVDQTNLLFELTRVAKASGVDLISIAPQPAQAAGTSATVVPINLSLDGSYFTVTRFLHNLRMLVSDRKNGCPVANGPTFAVTAVTLSPGDDKNEAPATVGIAAYYYGITGGAAPPIIATDTTTTTGT
jgi:hypothetical protein